MKIKWLGQAAFLITSSDGTKIITDPYTPNERLTYEPLDESADIVTVSHGHADHSNVAAIRGNPVAVKGTAEIKGITFKSIVANHDNEGGSKRGNINIYCFAVDGIRICHLGDLGHLLSDEQIAEVGKVDILMLPVGGFYTIDAGTATELYQKISPKVVLPMHYKNERCPNFPVAGVEDFIKGKKNVNQPDASEVEFRKEKLPSSAQIFVLKPAY